MNRFSRAEVYELIEAIENGTVTAISEAEAHNLLDGAQAIRTPLGKPALQVVNAALRDTAPEGMELRVFPYGNGYRTVVQPRGATSSLDLEDEEQG